MGIRKTGSRTQRAPRGTEGLWGEAGVCGAGRGEGPGSPGGRCDHRPGPVTSSGSRGRSAMCLLGVSAPFLAPVISRGQRPWWSRGFGRGAEFVSLSPHENGGAAQIACHAGATSLSSPVTEGSAGSRGRRPPGHPIPCPVAPMTTLTSSGSARVSAAWPWGVAPPATMACPVFRPGSRRSCRPAGGPGTLCPGHTAQRANPQLRCALPIPPLPPGSSAQ